MAYGRFECAVLHRVCSDIRYASGRRHPALPGHHNADLRMSRHTQTAEHNPAQPRSSEIQSAAYATAYVTQRMGDVPPRMGTEMQTYVCHGIQDGAETGTAIQIQQSRLPRTQPRTRMFADNARGGSPHHTLHVQCKASASLADRRLPVLAYRFRPIRPYRPVLALTGGRRCARCARGSPRWSDRS